MQKLRNIILLIAALFICASAEAERKTLHIDEQFSAVLESNPTTGFAWRLAKPLDESIVSLVGKEFLPKPNPRQLVGVGGREKWIFKATGKGVTDISLEYVRSWETSVPAVQTMNYTITVE